MADMDIITDSEMGKNISCYVDIRVRDGGNSLDALDRHILYLLDRNCRASYKYIGETVGISANAARKRIESLIEDGIIVEFYIMPKAVVIDCSLFFAQIITDGSEKEEEMFSLVDDIDEIAHFATLSYGNQGAYFMVGMYKGTEGMMTITNKLRILPNVLDVKFHPSLTEPGNKIELNGIQKRVLQVLSEDARASISQTAESTGLTSRRVRRVIDSLMKSNAFHFSVRWNLASKDLTQLFVFTHLKPKASYEDFFEWWFEHNGDVTWAALPSATEPLIVLQLVFDSLSEVQPRLKLLRDSEFVTEIHDYVVYSAKKYPWMGQKLLKELIQ
ncbi:MAG: winged helix-turn-helix transcriptional regulator [Candidatus Thorarchaeota archaeon]|jgi:DNA-binding Lrp family transcriptional regulator